MTSVEPRRIKGWDVALSIVFWVLALAFAILATVFEFIEVAFTDYCGDNCHPGVGIAGLFIIDAVIAIVVIVATVLTIVRLVRRRRAWWLMLIAFVFVILGSAGGYLVYATAVGYA